MSPRRLLAGILALGLAGSLAAGGPGGSTAQADAGPAPVTVSGTGPFSSLRVTVDQTDHLINQVVHLSWHGGATTAPSSGQFAVNFLQVMQCWGDAADGPTREQCQFGADPGDSRGGPFAASRQVSGLVTDPQEHDYVKKAGDREEAYVPFKAVTGEVFNGGAGTRNDFYDSYSTNEAAYGRTYDDGKGELFFEMETAREAPGLGCGEALTTNGTRHGRSCWLVVVPRGDTEVDGSHRSESGGSSGLVSSPLSSSNWAHRLVVPLSFEPMGSACPIGSAERPTSGQETVLEAVTHWQPALCAATGTIFGYAQLPDVRSRTLVTSSDPALQFVSRPVPAAAVPAGQRLLYAPVALSGIGIAFNLNVRPFFSAPPEIQAEAGARVPDIRLTPRLVAKLLTQTYGLAVDATAPQVAGNPPDLMHDEEFLELNPSFRLQQVRVWDMHVPIGLSDAGHTVWTWLLSDPEAKAFLDGKADTWGTRINPNFTDLGLPREDFPKADGFCADRGPDQPPFCTQDAHPYAADMHEGARSASRGDRLRKNWDPTALPPAYKKEQAQPDGARSVLSLVDAATAARYSLPLARLRNAAGEFVAPTDTSLIAGQAAMIKSDVPGVLLPAPRAGSAAAYPLTTLSYAVTSPGRLDAKARRDYANFLTYAVGPGQVSGQGPGQLPPGYVPLPSALRAQSRSAAAALRAPATPSTTPTTSTSGGIAGGSSGGGSGGGVSALGPSAVPTTGADTTATPATTPAAVTVSATTPSLPVGLSRFVVVFALAAGALALLAGPLMLRAAGGRPLKLRLPGRRPLTLRLRSRGRR
jgi:hypothetical protein